MSDLRVRGDVRRWWGVHGISIQGTAHSTTWRHGSPRDRDWRVRAWAPCRVAPLHCLWTDLALHSTPHTCRRLAATYTPSILVLFIGFLYSNKIYFLRFFDFNGTHRSDNTSRSLDNGWSNFSNNGDPTIRTHLYIVPWRKGSAVFVQSWYGGVVD